MATYEQKLEDAIVRAHESGDFEAAQMLADELKTWKPKRSEPEKTAADYAKGIGKGLIRGAADIGNTLINATTFIPRQMSPELERWNTDRQASLEDWTKANESDPLFTTGRIASNVAGTAGVGGLLAKGASAIPALSRFAPAIESGGFRLGNAATESKLLNAGIRATGGAIQGGVSTALVNPEDAATGAAIGAIAPGAVKATGEVGKGLKKAASTVATNLLGTTTGTGADAVSGAYQAGKAGASEFLDNIRGNISFDEVVTQAKQGLSNMRQARQEAYRSGMVDIKSDKTVLDFAPIDQAMNKLASMGRFKGVQINQKSAGTVDEMANLVDQWKNLDPAEYHTPEGLDALKQAIGDIRDSTQFGTPARKAADTLYNAVKNQINMQAPAYAKVMKDYSEASKLISEVEGALSLGEKAKADTAIRKLQSLMRNNAQTNYGNRLNMANALKEEGGVDVMPALAGQAMNSWTPRGIVGAIEKAGMVGTGVLNPAAIGTVLATAPITSPRLVGSAAYGLGRAVGGTKSLGNATLGSLGVDMPSLLDPAIYGRALPVGLTGVLPVISASQAAQR